MKYSIKKLILEIDGIEVNATPVPKNELEKVRSELENDGQKLSCSCGDQWCSPNGYLWVCNLGNGNNCEWFSTDWRCNP
ncbi:hypothetical protein [Flavobacterium okayamense]|uniref:Natural product n=1 Tax=Flavobacterium okayamense TaxID=2830782 RepID=A0ABM7S6W4_9FLAO|nr:hypothetical protein [Flavobacterium okayamense]BCY29096.1 hypothetical protein KK2020170_19640 [Flavobacterium okayamense]